MSYAKRWRERAISDTKIYWTPLRTLLTIAGPIVGSILWVLFKPWGGWWPIMQATAVATLAFLALWGLAFGYCFLLTPSKIEYDQQLAHAAEVRRLNEAARILSDKTAALIAMKDSELATLRIAATEDAKKNPIQEVRETQVRNWLGKLTNYQVGFIKWLLDHGEVEESRAINISGLHPNAVMEGISAGQKVGLVLVRSGTSLLNPGGERICSINPQFTEALINVLHIQNFAPLKA